MKKRKKKPQQTTLRCPYCGRTARLRPASDVYGGDTLDTDSFLYVCDGYPDTCDAYVGAHKKSLLPKGTLADSRLRHKRILAHRALDALWKQGYLDEEEQARQIFCVRSLGYKNEEFKSFYQRLRWEVPGKVRVIGTKYQTVWDRKKQRKGV